MGHRAGLAGGSGEGGEVDVGGQIGGARGGERIGWSPVTDRLEAVTRGAVFGTIVQEQRGARAAREAIAQGVGDGERGFIQLEDCIGTPSPPLPCNAGEGWRGG